MSKKKKKTKSIKKLSQLANAAIGLLAIPVLGIVLCTGNAEITIKLPAAKTTTSLKIS